MAADRSKAVQRIALIPGDGIGPEVIGVTRSVLEALPIDLELIELEAGWGAFERTGDALPPVTLATAEACGAILFGAVSSPNRPVPGYSSPIVRLRRSLDLYANLRPLVSAPVPTSRPGIDVLIVRENTEGLYSGREHWELEGEVAVAERVISRRASRRIAHRALSLALERKGSGHPGRLTVVHKANVLRLSDGLFRESVLEVAADFPEVEVEEQLVDSMVYRLIREPTRYDVVVAPNLYGDILSDAGAALVGGLGLAASANVGEGGVLAEPVHGSAPDIAGRGIANPLATVRAAALLLRELGHSDLSASLERAVEAVLREGPHPPDLGGSATTETLRQALRRRVEADSARG